MPHSQWLQNHPSAKNPAALARIEIAMARLPNILERQLVCCQKTLEQKISDQGPNGQRVDPHLLGIAIKELAVHRGIITAHNHQATGTTSWYANSRASITDIKNRLNDLAPLYDQVSNGTFPNLVGDALEVVVQESLISLNQQNPAFNFLGAMQTLLPKNKHGRFNKIEPPNVISGHASVKDSRFLPQRLCFWTCLYRMQKLARMDLPSSHPDKRSHSKRPRNQHISLIGCA